MQETYKGWTAPGSQSRQSLQFANKINEVLVGIMETIPEPDGAAKDGTDKMPAQKTKGKDEPELTLIIDATCSPEDIRFPQDESLLNEAREKLEKMIDQLFRQSGDSVKARTYREVARKDHLSFAKSKKRTEENTRDAVGKQLRYVARDIGHVQAYLERGLELDKKWETLFETIKALYEQQKKDVRRAHAPRRGPHREHIAAPHPPDSARQDQGPRGVRPEIRHQR